MKVEIHRLREMFLFIPTIGIDIEYRCMFICWCDWILYIGLGKNNY